MKSRPINSVAVMCAGGFRLVYRDGSVLEQHGFQRISNVVGGMSAWNSAAKLAVTV